VSLKATICASSVKTDKFFILSDYAGVRHISEDSKAFYDRTNSECLNLHCI